MEMSLRRDVSVAPFQYASFVITVTRIKACMGYGLS